MNLNELQKLKDAAIQKRSDRRSLNARLKRLKQDSRNCSLRLHNATKVQEFLQIVSKEVQRNIEGRISGLVQMALESVFEDDAPEFIVRFVDRRNKTECDLLFKTGKRTSPPIKHGGAGKVDVADFALRIVAWSLNKNRPVFFLDEPFHFVSHDLQPKVSDMLKAICKNLGVQINMVSHQPGINKAADRLFLITKKRGISKRKVISNL